MAVFSLGSRPVESTSQRYDECVGILPAAKMLFLTLVSLVFLIIPLVLASVAVGPWQLVYCWYAYQMDILANPKGGHLIASACSGSGTHGTCNFDQFIRETSRVGFEPDPGSSTGIKDQWPDAIDAVDKLQMLTTGGKPFKVNLDAAKLVGLTGSQTPSLKAVYKIVTDRIQEARKKLGDDALEEGLKQARVAITAQHQWRLHDNVVDEQTVLNNYLKKYEKGSNPVTIKSSPHIDGKSKFNHLDLAKATAANPAFQLQLTRYHTWLNNMQTKQGVDKTIKAVYKHTSAYHATSDFSARVHGDASC
ncbi:hypothetical protein NPX13_g9960 [Xylaria arbuscula]|uniref:Uncharacterized protein n=1 Tax=Xylaria arbuscula TaxID=114810 RepID=A0A9W8N5Y6_9PEZI|nr:hypothetical protein NPX13_g9960 [Xylaria arbuscula]